MKRGSGIKNLRAFNKALLSKWKWKLINEREWWWFEALVNRYGERDGYIRKSGRGPSVWWYNIWQLDKTNDNLKEDWLSSRLTKSSW